MTLVASVFKQMRERLFPGFNIGKEAFASKEECERFEKMLNDPGAVFQVKPGKLHELNIADTDYGKVVGAGVFTEVGQQRVPIFTNAGFGTMEQCAEYGVEISFPSFDVAMRQHYRVIPYEIEHMILKSHIGTNRIVEQLLNGRSVKIRIVLQMLAERDTLRFVAKMSYGRSDYMTRGNIDISLFHHDGELVGGTSVQIGGWGYDYHNNISQNLTPTIQKAVSWLASTVRSAFCSLGGAKLESYQDFVSTSQVRRDKGTSSISIVDNLRREVKEFINRKI